MDPALLDVALFCPETPARRFLEHHRIEYFRCGQTKSQAFPNRGRPAGDFAFIQLNPADWLNFLVVDVETTGLDLARDEIVSFAGVPVEEGRALAGAAVSGLVHPSAAPAPSSIEIHGLREADLAAAPEAAQALAPLAAALRGRPRGLLYGTIAPSTTSCPPHTP